MNIPLSNGPSDPFCGRPVTWRRFSGRPVGIRTVLEAAVRRLADIVVPSVLIIALQTSSTLPPGTSQALAQSQQTDSTHLDVLCRHLGIQPEKGVELGKAPRFFAATVKDPQPLFSMGLYGINAGDRINLINLGPGRWRIKHYATGDAIELYSRPPPSN